MLICSFCHTKMLNARIPVMSVLVMSFNTFQLLIYLTTYLHFVQHLNANVRKFFFFSMSVKHCTIMENCEVKFKKLEVEQ